MQKKLLYLAGILPAVILCSQLASCSLYPGETYHTQTAAPTETAASWHPAANMAASRTARKHSTHTLPQQKTTVPEKPCNTLQLQGSATWTPQTAKLIGTPSATSTPSPNCQSSRRSPNKIEIPVKTRRQSQPPMPVNGKAPVIPQDPARHTMPTGPGHINAPTKVPTKAGYGTGLNTQFSRRLHLYKGEEATPKQDVIGNTIAHALFDQINTARLTANLPPLQWSDALARSANKHSLAMAAANLMTHLAPGEQPLGARVTEQGVNWTWVAENVGYNTDQSLNGAIDVFNAMMAEKPPYDGHRRNTLTAVGNILGIDVFLDPVTLKMWITEDFAQI